MEDCIFSVFKMKSDSAQAQMEKKLYQKSQTVDVTASNK